MPFSILCRDDTRNPASLRHRQMTSARRLLRVVTAGRSSRRSQASS